MMGLAIWERQSRTRPRVEPERPDDFEPYDIVDAEDVP
jgi:hypothetical protein